MSKRTAYYCDFCGKELVGNDVGGGVEWIGETTTSRNTYGNPKTMIINFFIHNEDADTHMCHSCRKKLIKGDNEG